MKRADGAPRLSPQRFSLLAALLAAALLASISLAQGNATRPSRERPMPRKAAEKAERRPTRPAAREEAALSFVQQHHGELAKLLKHLKQGDPAEYERAVRDLYRTSERLAMLRQRDPQRYELELRHWKAQSEVNLLTARLMMQDSTQLRDELKAALREQLSARADLLRDERERLTRRLEKVDQQLERFANQPDAVVERQLQALLKASSRN